MTDADKANLRKLSRNPAFQAFMYRRAAYLFSIASTAPDARSLDFVEGRRSLVLEMLQEIEAAQEQQSPDGLPILASIQILVAAAQSAPKEKRLGRRNDPYRDLADDGDSDDDGDVGGQ